jgi:hypothetical protein
MVVVLAITLTFVDMLYIINANFKKSHEGFSGSVKFKDLSGVDISANDFIEKTLENVKQTNKPKPLKKESPTRPPKSSKMTESPTRPPKSSKMTESPNSEDDTEE